jgi:hypothetical protein
MRCANRCPRVDTCPGSYRDSAALAAVPKRGQAPEQLDDERAPTSGYRDGGRQQARG